MNKHNTIELRNAMSRYIYDKLIELKKQNYYPWHMPGHKRNLVNEITNLYDIDITEIDGFDNLHEPTGIIRKSMDYAKEVYHTLETFYLVNGSTVGILASISAVCKRGDTILIARNCHKAVYNAIRMLELEAVYLYPVYETKTHILGGMDKNECKRVLEDYPNIKAVVITSPNYEGVVINIKELALLTKSKNIPLIVDEAHGAHLIYHEYFPKSAIEQGADIVIQSLHKTLPCVTQTALLHVCSKSVDLELIKQYLSIYQTSSPSYIFMANIDYCIDFASNNKKAFDEYIYQLEKVRSAIKKLKYITLFELDNIKECKSFDYDKSKLVLCVRHTNITGKELYDILRTKYHIQLEMAERDYVIAMTSVMDTKEGYDNLIKVLQEIEKQLFWVKKKTDNCINFYRVKAVMKSCEALSKKCILVDYKITAGKIAGDYIYIYPPGIPLLVPGELINESIIMQISDYKNNGLSVIGMKNKLLKILE